MPLVVAQPTCRRLPRLDQTPRMAPHLFKRVSDIDAAALLLCSRARDAGRPPFPAAADYFDCGGTILACYDALADGDPERVGPNPQQCPTSASTTWTPRD